LEPDAPSEDIDIDADITFGGFALLACQFSKIVVWTQKSSADA